MNFGVFKEKSVQEQIAYLSDALDGKYVNYNIDSVRQQLFSPGHTTIAHQNISSKDILARTITELKTVSAFDMEESAEGLVEALLYEKVKDIAKWLSSENQRPLTLTLNMREYVGKGIDTSFKEKTTDVLTVVLQKDRDVLNDFGFHVKTAYPNIKHEDTRYTGKSFQKEALEILKTEESSLCKGFWGLAMSGFEPFVSNKNAETKVIVPLTPDKIEYLLVFSEYNIPTVYHNSPNNTSRPFRDISNPDLPLEISTEANRAINTFNKFVRELKPDISIEFESFRTDNAVFCENTER